MGDEQLRAAVERFIEVAEGGDMFCGELPQREVDLLRAALDDNYDDPTLRRMIDANRAALDMRMTWVAGRNEK